MSTIVGSKSLDDLRTLSLRDFARSERLQQLIQLVDINEVVVVGINFPEQPVDHAVHLVLGIIINIILDLVLEYVGVVNILSEFLQIQRVAVLRAEGFEQGLYISFGQLLVQYALFVIVFH